MCLQKKLVLVSPYHRLHTHVNIRSFEGTKCSYEIPLRSIWVWSQWYGDAEVSGIYLCTYCNVSAANSDSRALIPATPPILNVRPCSFQSAGYMQVNGHFQLILDYAGIWHCASTASIQNSSRDILWNLKPLVFELTSVWKVFCHQQILPNQLRKKLEGMA